MNNMDGNSFFQQIIQDQSSNPNQDRQMQRISRLSHLNMRQSLLTPNQEFMVKQLTSQIRMSFISEHKQYDQKYIIKLQSLFRGYQQRQRFLKVIKQFRYRRHILKELMQSEQSYVSDLQIIIESIIMPLKSEQTISANDLKIAFSNIQDIYNLNKSMLEAFQTREYSHYQLYLDIPLSVIPFFKLYFTYCNTYEKAMRIRDQLKLKNKAYMQLIIQMEKSQVLRSLDLEGFLVKPVQRLPKYVLLIKDILRHTPEDHPDYKNIMDSLHAFQVINEENNQKMDDIIRVNKVSELHKQYGEANKLSFQPRSFVFEEQLIYYVSFEDQRTSQVYFLTDQILITGPAPKIHKQIELSEKSICKEMPDTKYYANMIKLLGARGVTVLLIASSQIVRDKTISKVQMIIEELKNSSKNQDRFSASDFCADIQVSVLGTEEHSTSTFSKYTVYIVQIKKRSSIQKVHLRYSEIRDLEDYCRRHFKGIDIPHFSSMQWFQNHSTKLLEQRKLQIETFLQTVLSDPEVQADPKEILSKIGLGSNFYQVDVERAQNQSSITDTTMYSTMSSQSSSYEQKFMNKLQQAQSMSYSEEQVSQMQNAQKSQVSVYLLNEKAVSVEVDWKMQAIQVCEQVAEKLKLEQFYDFKLYIMDSKEKENFRVIEDDQILMKALPKKSEQGVKKILKLISQETNYILLFQKYVFLPNHIEEIEYKQDEVRVQLLLAQQFYLISRMKYHLSTENYVFYAALYLYVHFQMAKVYVLTSFPFEELDKVLPSQIYKTMPKDAWKNQITKVLKEITDSTNKILDSDQDQQKWLIASIVALSSIQQHSQFGVTYFPVECPKKLISYYNNDLQLKLAGGFLMGVSHRGVSLQRHNSAAVEIEIESISNVKAFPNSIQFVSSKLGSQPLRFKSAVSYQIMQLLSEYIDIHKYI